MYTQIKKRDKKTSYWYTIYICMYHQAKNNPPPVGDLVYNIITTRVRVYWKKTPES